ncbi:MAG TPA: HU family DNA-binding protein [Planctomycetota bacterium]|nr:HU family DNA-binding protein [Planctomycetota bacterium]
MNKAELVESVRSNLGDGMSRSQVKRAVDGIFTAVARGLTKSGRVQVAGFGTFTVRRRKPRNGRNPKTGEKIVIQAMRTVGFKPSPELRLSLART